MRRTPWSLVVALGVAVTMTAMGAIVWRVHRIGIERACRTGFVRCEGSCRARLCPPPVLVPHEDLGCEPVDNSAIVDESMRAALDRCLATCIAGHCEDLDTVADLAPDWPFECGFASIP